MASLFYIIGNYSDCYVVEAVAMDRKAAEETKARMDYEVDADFYEIEEIALYDNWGFLVKRSEFPDAFSEPLC